MMMASEDQDAKDPDWVHKLKTGGPVPLKSPEDCTDGAWASPPGHNFLVRGPDYLSTKAKVPAGDWLLRPLAFDWVKSNRGKIREALSSPSNRVRAALEEVLGSDASFTADGCHNQAVQDLLKAEAAPSVAPATAEYGVIACGDNARKAGDAENVLEQLKSESATPDDGIMELSNGMSNGDSQDLLNQTEPGSSPAGSANDSMCNGHSQDQLKQIEPGSSVSDSVTVASSAEDLLKQQNPELPMAAAKTPAGEGVPFVWAFNLQVPSKENYSAIAYFVSFERIEEGSLMHRFLTEEDDGFRNARLKLIANVVNGPWIVKAAVGEQAICILGRAVSCRFIRGIHFLEVDVDIGASMLANAVVHLALGYVSSLTVDLAFLIEAQSEHELPERLLGAVRFANLDPAAAVAMDPEQALAGSLKEPSAVVNAEQTEEEEEEEEEEFFDDEGQEEGEDEYDNGDDDNFTTRASTAEVEAAVPAASLTSRWWKSFSTYINGEEPNGLSVVPLSKEPQPTSTASSGD